ncbi:hypothetical protein [Humisphaera borealis]|uniref:FAD-dependent oxidoreductase n=1 Tax=Humisphaera borealis TaxID=2807512 RepID=A0A7M2X1F2_9BACT|nr:hypothetical protein [Humisphaera borealis]QOV90560.1 hypothetical protein IPV69_04105 [Humisphaera borealis]
MGTGQRIFIIGGGPIGLEAAAYGRAAGLDVVLAERKDIGASVASWGFVRMFTPWHLNTTPLGRATLGNDPLFASNACPTGQEFVDQYLLPLAESDLLQGCIDTGFRVLAVGHEEPDTTPGNRRRSGRFRLLVCDRYGIEQIDHADYVLDCSGTYGNRRWAGRGGVPAVGEAGVKSAIWYTVPDVLGADRASFENRRTMLVGAGTSALTVLQHLATLAAESPMTRVTWVVRRWGEVLSLADEDPLPARRALAEAALRLLARPPAWLDVHENATVDRLDASHGLTAWLSGRDGVVERHVDEMIAAVGFRPDEMIHEPLGVTPAYADFHATEAALGTNDLSVDSSSHTNALQGPPTVPSVGSDYYLLGHKSFGTNSNFLLRTGHRQVREVFREITGEPDFDLYATANEACVGMA